MRPIPPWVFRDFNSPFSDLFWAAVEQGDAKKEVAWIVQVTSLRRGASVLDLGCGDGRHAIEFARRRYFTTGVDCCNYPLKKAASLIRKGFSKYLSLVKDDVRTFRKRTSYDLITLLGNTLVCLAKKEHAHLLKHVFSMLKPGGYFIFDTNYYSFQRRRPSASWIEPKRNQFKLTSRKFDDRTGVGVIELIALAKGRICRNVSTLYFPKLEELIKMCRENGFGIQGRFGSLTGDAFLRDKSRLVMVLQKMDQR